MLNLKHIKGKQLLWIFQLLIIGYFLIASYNYHLTWGLSQGFIFSKTNYFVFSLLNLACILVFPLLNHFYVFDKLINNKKIIWLFLIIIMELYLSMIGNAAIDTLFLQKYKPVWLMTRLHIYSRFFINLSFFGLFSLHKLIENYFKKSEDEKKLKIGQLESEIKLLRSQINPHFLFNSLNNIYSYAVQKKDGTPDLILKLSNILRFLSDTKNHQFYINADKEIETTRSLFDLYLVNKRWLNKAELIVKKDEGYDTNFKIEPHSILTLAENSFKHCNLDEENAYIKMEITLTKNEIVCKTDNTIRNTEVKDNSGTGLSNLQKRLKISYNNTFSFNFKAENNIFSTVLKLPLLNNETALLHN